MADEADDNIESTNDATEEVENTEEVEEVTDADVSETEDQPDEEKVALREQNKKLFERAKKAESDLKKFKGTKTAPVEQSQSASSEKQDGISTMDAIVLSKASVHEDDVEEVVNYAKFRGITIKEALADNTMQSILRDKDETRKTAEATNIGPARRGSVKLTDEQIIKNAQAGKEVDPEALAEARWNQKLSK